MGDPVGFTHYGIKGMHWGVTKTDSTKVGRNTVSSTNTKIKNVELSSQTKRQIAPSKDASSAAISKKKVKTKSLDALSNDELKRLVARMNLEKQYNDLKKQDMTPTQKFVNDIMEKSVKKDLSNFAATTVSKQLQNALKSKS